MFARMGSITAQLPLARLQRFAGQLANDKGQVAVDLRFGRDEEGRRLLSGAMDATVQVACQRCLRDMDLDLHSTLSLFVLDNEQDVQALREDQDGVVMPADGNLDVLALLEDELLLSLPMIPLHADPACNEVLNALKAEGDQVETRPNPFAVLQELRTGKATQPGKDEAQARPGKDRRKQD